MEHRSVTQAPAARRRAAAARAGTFVAGTLVAGVLAAGVLAAVPFGAADASAAGGSSATCSPAALSVARAGALHALTRRIMRLNTLSTAVGAATGLTAADRATLATDLGNELSALTALQQKVPADTTCADVATDAHDMVVDYRVFAVMSPQVHLAIAADTEAAMAATLKGLDPRIAARITTAKQQGATVGAAEATFSDFQSQVASATQSASGVAGSILALTPASYPGSRQTLVKARVSLAAGRAALVAARAGLRTLKADAR